MKVLLLVFITVIGTASASLLHHPALANVIPGAVTHSTRVGGNFAYSTVEGPVVAAPILHHGVLGAHQALVAPGLVHHGVLAHGLHHGLVHHTLAHHLGVIHG